MLAWVHAGIGSFDRLRTREQSSIEEMGTYLTPLKTHAMDSKWQKA
jgi:hypothetical protein